MRFTNPPTLSRTAGYSHVVEVRSGRTIHVSGQIALDQSGNVVGVGDFAAQTEQVFRNIALALESVGASFDDVARLTVYVVDTSQVQTFRDIRDRFVNTANPPASTLIRVAGLVRDDLLIEIEATAYLSD